MKRLLIILLVIVINANVFAQISTNEKPFSFGITAKHWNDTKTVVMPALDMAMIEAEDHEDEESDMPPRFGYPHKVNYDLNNSGTWYELPNGDKLWQLNVVCPNALSVNFCYDKFWIPEGGKFFVYSKDKKHSIGAFTNRNNKGDREYIQGFATEPIFGSNVVLEYYQPKTTTQDAIISIEYIVHGYRYINSGERFYGEAGPCMVNVNCEEGQNWQNEKKAIAHIILQGRKFCTGSLINTTNLSQEPFFLIANHAIKGLGDAVGNATLNHQTLLIWNYEEPGCVNDTIQPGHYSTHGAIILANDSVSDFALLRLIEDPKDIPYYTPYYLGWDCSGESGGPGVCIHHPKGDVKKISTVFDTPTSSNYGNLIIFGGSHWRVYWKETQNGFGTTDTGSSGSPLLNAEHRVIGQLHSSYTHGCLKPNWYCSFGKFNVSWTGNGNSSIYRRLNCWLDSLNTGVQTMEGLLIISADSTINVDQQLYSNIRVTNNAQLTIKSNIELMGICRLIVETGSKLIIDGGTLSNVDIVLKPKSSLQIINNGIIETRNGFEAPLGAIIDIENGQIL